MWRLGWAMLSWAGVSVTHATPAIEAEKTGLPPQPTLAPEVAAALPEAGYWFATQTRHGARDQGPDVLFVYRLKRTGLEVVLRVPNARADGLVWLDAHTLLTVEVDRDANVITQRIVDGVPQPAVTIPETAWKVTAAHRARKRIEVRHPDTSLIVARPRQVWLRRCVAGHTAVDRCDAWHYLRVDGKVPVFARLAPAGVFDPAAYPPPKVAAPPGITVKLAKVEAEVVSRRGIDRAPWKGFTCVGAGGGSKLAVSWPTDDPTYDPSFPLAVDTITWRSAKPPIFEVSGQATNPLAERFRRSELFHACSPSPAASVYWLPGGLRADARIMTSGTTYLHARWTLFHGTHEVAELIGSEGRLAVAPLK